MLSIACALWSAATIACGLSASYGQLVAARMAVGVGEAGGVPPSYAIVSGYFARGRRGTALGLFNLGPPIGQTMGVALGASIALSYGWRSAFIALGAAGLVAALVVAVFVREPVRGGLDPNASLYSAEAVPQFGTTIRLFFTDPVLLLAAFGSGITQIITYGAGNFSTLFLMREKGMTLHQVAIYYALFIAICMSGGIFASGRVIDRLVHRSRAAYGLVPASIFSPAAWMCR